MADWTNLPNTAVGVGGLPSGTTVTALRDNPVAISEGAAGAPRILGSAIRANLLVDSSLTTPAASFVVNNLPDHYAIYVSVEATPSATATVDVNVSNDNGVTWSPRIWFVNGSVAFERGGYVYSNSINSRTLGFGSAGDITFNGPIDAIRVIAQTNNLTACRVRVFGIMRDFG